MYNNDFQQFMIDWLKTKFEGAAVLIDKIINANGVYEAVNDNADGYKKVTVNVPQPSGTKQISITQNGTTTEDVEQYEDAEITVNVPQPSGTKHISITQNGTTTEDIEQYEYADITVNVPVPTLESKSISANGTYTPAVGKAWNEVVVSVPADTLQADFVTIRSERLIAGANSVSNTVNLLTYLASLKSIAGLIFAFSIEPKSTYAYNEIGAGQCAIISNTNEAFTYRYRSGWAKIAWGNTAYDAVLPEGTNLTIFTVDTVMPT